MSLKQDAKPPTIDSHLLWVDELHDQSLTRRDEAGIYKVWKNNFKGYSGEFDEETLEEVRQNEDVRTSPLFCYIFVSDYLGCCC